jgi:hypothetical protein
MLYVPRHLPAPDEEGWSEAAAAETLRLVELTAGRALLLFTSWRGLHAMAAALRGKTAHRLRVQGEAPRGALLEDFRRNGGLLLATASFWEGIDVPGEALSLVVIDRLPFAPPDDPLLAARMADEAEAGRDPFQTIQLPRAALALKQGFGRLIRRQDDRGIVAVLDGRIVTRGYGKVFLETLPPARRTSTFEQVRRFWAGEAASESPAPPPEELRPELARSSAWLAASPEAAWLRAVLCELRPAYQTAYVLERGASAWVLLVDGDLVVRVGIDRAEAAVATEELEAYRRGLSRGRGATLEAALAMARGE